MTCLNVNQLPRNKVKPLKMNRFRSNSRRIIAVLAFALLSLNFVSCKSTKQASMSQKGNIGFFRQLLILPFGIFGFKDRDLASARPTEYLTGFLWSVKEEDLDPAFIKNGIDNTLIAESVLGAPGLVYSPHVEGKLVDVNKFTPGDEVVCPHSGLPFIVPNNADFTFNKEDEIPAVAVDNAEIPNNLESNKDELKIELAEKEVLEGQVAKSVAGKDNLVFSPFTKGSYIVDITGLKPGDKARCPYTGKIFIIPQINLDSTPEKSEPRNIVEEAIASISENVDFKVFETKIDKKMQGIGTSDKSTVPFARWSKRVGYVISPFGGQLIDVQGKVSGSVLRCPFSGELFKLPPVED